MLLLACLARASSAAERESDLNSPGICVLNVVRTASLNTRLPFLKKFRCSTLMLTSIPFFIGYLTMGLTTTIAPIMIGRVLTGVGVGMSLFVAPLYIAEIAPPSTRGILGVLYQLVSFRSKA